MWWQLATEQHMANHESCCGERCFLSEGHCAWELHCVENTFASWYLPPFLLCYTCSFYLMLNSSIDFFGSQMRACNNQHHLHSVSGRWQGSHFYIFAVRLLCFPAAPLVDCQKLTFLFSVIVVFFFLFLLSSSFSVKKTCISFKMFLKPIWVYCKYYCCCIK